MIKRISILSALLLITAGIPILGQDPVYSYFYRVYLKDKDNYTGNTSTDLLSSKAIKRRQNAGIPYPDYKDFPVGKSYINQISRLGLKLHTTSKWMNTALFKSQTSFDLNKILSLPFVADVKIVKNPGTKSVHRNKLDFLIEQPDPSCLRQTFNDGKWKDLT